MDVRIRPGRPSDLEELLEVLRGSSLYRHYWGEDESPLRSLLEDALERGILLAAVGPGDRIAGLAVCEPRGMFAAYPYLALLGVREGLRGMGVGHRLLDAFERIARETGARRIFICVSSFNPRARALYLSVGYRKAAVVPDLNKDGIDEWVLTKRLAP